MKKMKNTITAVVAGTMILVFANSASAASCSYISTGDQGDDYYMWGSSGWQCQQQYVDYWWDAFEFEKKYWDDGMGYYDACNNGKPLARMFNGLYALGYSSTNTPSCSTSSDNVTLWAMCWAASKMKRTRAKCGSGTASGTPATSYSGVGVTKRVEYYWPYFYGMSVGQRANVVFHEARHQDGCKHNGDHCLGGGSCDKSWSNGCKTIGKQAGANRYSVTHASWYASTAWRTTTALKADVVAYANKILWAHFDTFPGFFLDANGNPYST